MKKSYQTPQLTVHGAVAQITQGNKDGDNLDRSFPVNTPKKNLLFS